MEITQKKPHFFTLFLLMSFTSVTAVSYTPALPAIAHFFAITAAQAQYTVTSYLLGFALGPLIYGPLANHFGRRLTLKLGLSATFLITLLCLLASALHLFWCLVVLRFIQALAAACGMTLAFTITGDYYQERTAKILPLIMSSFAIMPGVSTTLCGYLVRHFTWISVFYFMLLYTVLVLILVFWLPETRKTPLVASPLNWQHIIKRYAEQVTHQKVLLFCSIMGLATANIYVFAAVAPFLAIQKIGISAAEYGTWMLLAYFGMLIGSALTSWLAHYVHPFKTMVGATIGLLVCAILMTASFEFYGLSSWKLFGMGALVFAFELMIFSNSSALASMVMEDKSNVSAIMTALNMVLAFVTVQIVAELHGFSILIMPIIFVLIAVSILAVAGAFWRKLV